MLYILKGIMVLGTMSLATSVANRVNAQFRDTLRSLGNWNSDTYRTPFSIIATDSGYIVEFNVFYVNENRAVQTAEWIHSLFPWVVKDEEVDSFVSVVEFNDGEFGDTSFEAEKDWGNGEEPPEQPDEWAQPTGAHDAYSSDDRVMFSGQVWESLINGNVWAPNVTGWRRVVDEDGGNGIAPWQQPLGAHDAYPLGVKVSHKGSDWESEVDNNVWEPGVFGWKPL